MRVFVKAKADAGFNRAGRRWPSGGTEADVDAETLAVLEAEPMLEVVRISEPEPEPVVTPEPVPVVVFDKPRHKHRR